MIEIATDLTSVSRKMKVKKKFPVQLFRVDSWQEFDDAYIKGPTNKHLHSLLDQMEIETKLGKGVFRLKLSIHMMPHCDTETGELIPLLMEMLNGIYDVFWEEMDLMPFAEKMGEKVLDCTSRGEKLDTLLQRHFYSKGINEGYRILKEFCVAHPFIMKSISDIMGKRAEDESLLGQELFTAGITLDTTESPGGSKMNIVVEDPKLHFDTVEDARKAVSSTVDQQMIGALLGFAFDTTEENEGKVHQNVLNRCLPDLVVDVDFDNVSIYIQQKEIFNVTTLRDISEQPTTTMKIKELIKQIQVRDQDAYIKFKDCLVQAKQESLKVMLEKEEAKFAEEIKGKRHLKRKRSIHNEGHGHLSL